MSDYLLNPNLYDENVVQDTIRAGFGRGLRAAGEVNDKFVALCADLTESTQISIFSEAFPDRFIQTGIAEQNLVAVASGLAAAEKIPFASSYAAFNPGRNWEHIKTTIKSASFIFEVFLYFILSKTEATLSESLMFIWHPKMIMWYFI